MILVVFRPFMHTYFGHQLAWMLVIPAFLLMIEALRRETKPKMPWRTFWILVAVWTVCVNLLYFLGYTASWGIAAYRTLIFVLCSALWFLVMRLRNMHPSKSLLLLQIGLMLYALPPLLGMMAYLTTNSEDVMNVYKFSVFSNILVFGFMLAVMFMSWGYWGYTLEKSERERNLAKVGEDKAVQDAERYRQLVDERDQLLVMNSRFSVVSSLSSFSAMLIHDITQPLQTLQLGLERVRANLIKGATRNQIEDDLLHLEHASDRAGALVLALRSLMQSGEKQTAPVPIEPMMRQIEDILSSEALQKKVAVHFEYRLPVPCAVMADRVMLQRIIINVVSNSLNHFAVAPVVNPEVVIRLNPDAESGQAGLTIEIQDNGGGFPQALLERVGQPWSSHQPQGLGMALMLSKQLLGIWGGQLRLSNRADGQSGALVRIWLRLAD